MPSRFHTVVVDARDPAALAQFWKDVLDWQTIYESSDEVVIAKNGEQYPGLVFGSVPEEKQIKNRLHIDLAPDDRDAEVERIVALGATHADVGQGDDVTWVVLADPEGNEFCVLSARDGGM
jgi:predicted enzyme related to lactoylglutathione lyase